MHEVSLATLPAGARDEDYFEEFIEWTQLSISRVWVYIYRDLHHQRQGLDEIEDLSSGERGFMTLWNGFMLHQGCVLLS